MTKSFGVPTDRATEYCTFCPKLCRFSCPIAEVEHRETVTPWGLMRLLEYARRGTVAGSEETAEIFYHCTGCARCQTMCRRRCSRRDLGCANVVSFRRRSMDLCHFS